MKPRIAVPIIASLAFFITHTVSAKPPIKAPEGCPVLADLHPYLLETLYKTEDTDTGLKAIVDTQEFKTLVKRHDLKLFGGPILGCVTDTRAKFWVRTPGPAQVQVVAGGMRSDTMTTGPNDDYSVILELKGLSPLTSYAYNVLVNGKKVFGAEQPTFRTYPAKGQKAKFGVGFGGGARYNPPKEKIWNVIASYTPAAFLFLGDNVYIDLPHSRTKQRVHYYRRYLRPEYQRLTATAAIYGIYDDHDLGKNDCAGGPDPFKPEWKFPSWKVFRENWNNPYYGGGDKQPGCWFDFSIGDVDFIMLDNRYYRSFKDGTMLGPVQKQWLLDKLKQSEGTFKVICSGTLWTEHADKGGKDSWWGVKEEREEIFSFIDKHKIGGVILLSADRHRTDVYRIHRPNGYDFYEFETSKLTNNHTHGTRPKALFSYNKGNFFGLLTFDLTKQDPEVTFQCITMDKKSVHSLTLKRSQLQAK